MITFLTLLKTSIIVPLKGALRPCITTATSLVSTLLSYLTIVSALENSIIATLAEYGIEATADPKRPGVYVGERKIASLGLRIKDGSVYHGLALNVNMDLSPFTHINPCGYAGMEMTQIADFVQPCPTLDEVAQKLTAHLETCH